ncbi:hypothetical protein EKK58_03105 [Candidatus Dependentiae bacterium]|nr:MAG: hypothetical protein EKK58_03105 [Candidatus Dependentiae bacterium]
MPKTFKKSNRKKTRNIIIHATSQGTATILNYLSSNPNTKIKAVILETALASGNELFIKKENGIYLKPYKPDINNYTQCYQELVHKENKLWYGSVIFILISMYALQKYIYFKHTLH